MTRSGPYSGVRPFGRSTGPSGSVSKVPRCRIPRSPRHVPVHADASTFLGPTFPGCGQVRQCDSNRQTRWLTIRIVNRPSGAGQTRTIVARGWVLEVWGPGCPTPRLLDRSVVPPAVPPRGDERVPYYDPQLIDGITAAVLPQHFPRPENPGVGGSIPSQPTISFPLLDAHPCLSE